ncbi:cell division protein SepF [bacterium]|nr:cell division protein SepF [bacterium]
MQEHQEKGGLFAKIKNFFTVDRFEEEEPQQEEIEEFNPPKSRWSLRLYSRKDVPVYRREVKGFEEVEEPALRLRQGFIVIVNLENASEEARRRSVDFLMGVTFGIRGSFEKVGDKVYLFAPPGYTIS